MLKEEVELIILKISSNNQDAISLKIYKDGTIVRHGTGGLPPIEISGLSIMANSDYFDSLMEDIPQEILLSPKNYEEENHNGYVEYVVAFYGVTTNGEHSENAKWSKSTGIRVRLNLHSSFQHKIVNWLDYIITEATELTNDWYFDIMINTMYGLKSTKLPPDTLISFPKEKEKIQKSFQNYINQIMQNQRWDIYDFINHKYFKSPEGEELKGVILRNEGRLSIRFLPL